MKSPYAILFSLLLSTSTYAQVKPLVIFFGGSGFNQARNQAWTKAAQEMNSAYDYFVINFPEGAFAPYETVVTNGKKQIQSALAEIKKFPGRKLYIVGHSSGSALADQTTALAAKAGLIQPDQATEILLEGFRPRSQFSPVECWTTTNQNAPNWKSMHDGCVNGAPKKWPAESCGNNKNCLHFSLVNSGANYDNFQLNLKWLPVIESQALPGT